MRLKIKLFFIAHTSDRDESFDWFVAARSKSEAVLLWRGIDMVKDMGIKKPDAVFLITCASLSVDKSQVLDWNTDGHEDDGVKLV